LLALCSGLFILDFLQPLASIRGGLGHRQELRNCGQRQNLQLTRQEIPPRKTGFMKITFSLSTSPLDTYRLPRLGKKRVTGEASRVLTFFTFDSLNL